ncbi:MAG: APC family permease [Kofleriaceae bacterium]
MSTTDATTRDDAPTALRRAISPRMLVVFIIGDILGAGIYALVGKLAGHVGGAVWLPLLIAFVVAALTAASYAELVGRYPRAAGAALYVHRAFRSPLLTFMVAFAVMLSGISSASAAALAFGGDYLAQLVTAPPMVAALAFLAIITLVNFIGISESIKVNLVLTIIEASGLVIVLVVGAIAIARGDGDPTRALVLEAPRGTWLGVLGATALGFYALLGFEDAVNLAEETEAPSRSFPRALALGLALTGVVYVAIAFVAVTLVEPATLATGTGPLQQVVAAGGVAFPPEAFAVIALLAIGNTALINMIMASRLLYGMAHEGIVPHVFARVHARRQTPSVAIVFTVLIAVVLIATGSVVRLAQTTVLLLLVVFALVNVSVLVVRRTPVAHAHFKTPTWAAALGAVTCVVLASPITGRSAEVYATAGILLAIGAALWGIGRLVRGPVRDDFDPTQLVK